VPLMASRPSEVVALFMFLDVRATRVARKPRVTRDEPSYRD
jgi:hypothetical protein